MERYVKLYAQESLVEKFESDEVGAEYFVVLLNCRGGWVVQAWSGKRRYTDLHYSYGSGEGSEARARQVIASFIKSVKLRKERRDAEKAERKAQLAKGNDFVIGDIIYNSWGYEQTNVDFYEVVDTTKNTVTLKAIHSKEVEQLGWASNKVEPVKGNFVEGAKPFVRRVVGNSVSFEFGCGSRYKGGSLYCSSLEIAELQNNDSLQTKSSHTALQETAMEEGISTALKSQQPVKVRDGKMVFIIFPPKSRKSPPQRQTSRENLTMNKETTRRKKLAEYTYIFHTDSVGSDRKILTNKGTGWSARAAIKEGLSTEEYVRIRNERYKQFLADNPAFDNLLALWGRELGLKHRANVAAIFDLLGNDLDGATNEINDYLFERVKPVGYTQVQRWYEAYNAYLAENAKREAVKAV